VVEPPPGCTAIGRRHAGGGGVVGGDSWQGVRVGGDRRDGVHEGGGGGGEGLREGGLVA
jgi:hypothetical protein